MLKCWTCCAGRGSIKSGRLLYDPQLDIGVHPEAVAKVEREELERQQKTIQKREAAAKVDKVKSKQVKTARKQEKKVADKINRIYTQTINSGAVNGDGDLKAFNGLIQADHKMRFTTKNFAVTWAEYKEGTAQGTNQWLITVKDEQGKLHTLVCLTDTLYNQLLSMLPQDE